MKTLHALGKQALIELVFATHAGMTEEEFDAIAQAWLATAKHPEVRPAVQAECTYRPQVELLDLSARERLQDLHRLRRRHRPDPRLRRGGLRHPARAGDRIERQDCVSRCRDGGARC